MIIGSDRIDYKTLLCFRYNQKGLVNYAESLVPIWLRHIRPIVDNQRYYVAIHVRNLKSVPYKEREVMINALVDGIRLQGAMNCFFTVTELLNACDLKSLIAMLEEYDEYTDAERC